MKENNVSKYTGHTGNLQPEQFATVFQR